MNFRGETTSDKLNDEATSIISVMDRYIDKTASMKVRITVGTDTLTNVRVEADDITEQALENLEIYLHDRDLWTYLQRT